MSFRIALVSAALALPTSLAQAGIVYVQQNRTVEAVADTSVTDSQSAADLGAFDGQAVAQHSDPELEDGVTVTVTQDSRLENASATASGALQFAVAGEYGEGRSVFDATFDVTDSPTDFTLRYALEGSRSDINKSAFEVDVLLERLNDGGAATPVVGPTNFEFLTLEQEQEVTAGDTETGTLAPGRYRVLFDIRGLDASFESGYRASYDFELEFSDDGGPGPNPIPLPAAAWAALATAGAFGGAKGLRGLRRLGRARA